MFLTGQKKKEPSRGEKQQVFFPLSFLKMDGRLAEMVATFFSLPYIRSLSVAVLTITTLVYIYIYRKQVHASTTAVQFG